MCGIAGIVRFRGAAPEPGLIERMCDTITHRGPDDAGYHVFENVAVGMRRLSIIDLSTGHQPIFNEDRSACVVFNGEIYNYLSLRAELESLGHRFSTNSDTEVIVHLWEEYGERCAHRLNGMFAFAVVDLRARKLFIARDHVGIKPLYFISTAEAFVFGSEVKVLLASGAFESRLKTDALAQFLSWEYVPGADTLMQGVQRLDPASSLKIDLKTGRIEKRRFWDPLEDAARLDRMPDDEEWLERLDSTIRNSVERQLISDVPLGAFLSGGVDSSLVVAAMGDAETFSIGFDDPSYNETGWSKRVADHLNVRHHVEVIRPQALELFDHLMEFMDDPIGDFSIFPTYLVSRLASRHVKVVLSGDGGDELFGGYDTYVAEQMSAAWRRLPLWLRRSVVSPLVDLLPPTARKKGLVNKVKRFVEGARMDPALGHTRWRLFCEDSMRRALFSPAALEQVATPVNEHVVRLAAAAAHSDSRDRSLYVDFRSYLVDNCLTKVDRMSMACSIEARVPLLDRELVEMAFAMPAHLKIDGRRTKVALKRIASRYVPEECVYRAKEGFSIPIKNWLKVELRELVNTYLDADRLRSAGVFDADVVSRLRREHEENRANHSHLLWSLLVFEHWRDRWGVAV